jgi:endonuclease YncB( thermonuclease family)
MKFAIIYDGESKAKLRGLLGLREKVMTPMDLQDRAQYLSLALFSQNIVSVLMEYVDENKLGKLKPCLTEALESLVQTTRSMPPTQHNVAAFNSYEHLRTLDEVWSAKKRASAIKMVRTVLAAPRKPGTKDVANQLIDLFSELQNQALWNFEQPKPVSPKIMRRLCQPA